MEEQGRDDLVDYEDSLEKERNQMCDGLKFQILWEYVMN
jgi:hypothetical protein